MEGWICLYKKLINWEWYQDGNTCRLFIHLLLLANYEDKYWQGQLIKRGQLVTSLEHLSDDLGLSVQQIRTSIKKLKSTGEITSKATNKYTLVTIERYEDYQSKEEKATSKITNEQQTNNKQITTTNNITNINKIKLNYLYLYITEKAEKFEGLNEMDKLSLQSTLKKLELYIENDSFLPQEKIFELQLKYYAISQIYLSPYKVYLMDLKEKEFTRIFLSAKKYCPIKKKTEKQITDFMNYFIVCLRKEFEKK
jgi:biotin operon repressor